MIELRRGRFFTRVTVKAKDRERLSNTLSQLEDFHEGLVIRGQSWTQARYAGDDQGVAVSEVLIECPA